MTAPERLSVNEETDGLGDQRDQRDRQHSIVKDGTSLFCLTVPDAEEEQKGHKDDTGSICDQNFMGSLLSLSGDEMDEKSFPYARTLSSWNCGIVFSRSSRSSSFRRKRDIRSILLYHENGACQGEEKT